jgi:hypothetical protein
MLHAHRGPFYSPKRPRSHWSHIWKAPVAFCLRVHRTVWWCTQQLLHNGYESSDWPPSFSSGHQTVQWHTRHVRWPFLTIACLRGQRWSRGRSLACAKCRCSPSARDCLVVFSQRASVFSRERLVWASRPGQHLDMSDAHQLLFFWAKLLTIFLDRLEKFPST